MKRVNVPGLNQVAQGFVMPVRMGQETSLAWESPPGNNRLLNLALSGLRTDTVVELLEIDGAPYARNVPAEWFSNGNSGRDLDIVAGVLEHWEEETGVLIQTESDFAQRERIRERLNTKLATLKWVLQEETPAPLRAGRVPA